MKLRLLTALPEFAEPLSEVLTHAGLEVEVLLQSVSTSELRYVQGIPFEQITHLVGHLRPLLPSVTIVEALDGADAELYLGDVQPLTSWDLKIYADSEQISARLRNQLLPLGFSDDGVIHGRQEKNELKFGGATDFARQVVRWFLAREGIRVSESKEWGDTDNDIWIHIQDPAFAGKDPKSCFTVELGGDDYEHLLGLRGTLVEAGYHEITMKVLDPDITPRFQLLLGPFDRDASARDELVHHLEAFLRARGVDLERTPLLIQEDSSLLTKAVVTLPLATHATGELYPYAGAFPERWDIVVHTDDASRLQAFRDGLLEQGFRVRFQPLPERALSFFIKHAEAASTFGVIDHLGVEVQAVMEQLGALADFKLSTSASTDLDNDDRIEIVLPTKGIEDGSLLERLLGSCSDWELSFKTARPADWPDLVSELRELSWKSFSVDTEEASDAVIKFGGAPPALVAHVAQILKRHSGVTFTASKAWSNEDDDIWVYFPASVQVSPESVDVQADLDAWFPLDESAVPAPFLTLEADTLRIANVVLPRRSHTSPELVPPPRAFSHYCLDQRTAETLLHVAESVVLREPCLLEGETSVSKTSCVQFLAMLLGQPLVRINLNGQTDTGELVGRFLPQGSADTLPIPPHELLARPDLLTLESRSILERSESEGRSLSRLEVQQVMAHERMQVHPWRWQDGLIISAMKQGWWVVLDELNLAEPQILERLNSALERYPSLVLTEHNNEIIGAGGSPIHPAFRIFATMNPAEYAGRSQLSPAYRDRWRAYRFVDPPGEHEYFAMLRFLVHGVQPSVVLRGRRFQGAQQDAPLAALAGIPDIDPFLRALARFHAALEGAVGASTSTSSRRAARLGARRRERYIFTRRGLLSIMDYLASPLCAFELNSQKSMRTAIMRYYLGRISDPADRSVVLQLLDAAGLGPHTWSLSPPFGDEV